MIKSARLLVASLAVLVMAGCAHSQKDSVEDSFTGYDDIISLIVEGYQSHWAEGSPEKSDLSAAYKHCSVYGGFAKEDIDGDGTDELLIGDVYEDSSYHIYDIFTHDSTTGEMTHLFKGGERDWCVVNSEGIILESHSNSANFNFDKCYKIKKLELVEVRNKNMDVVLRDIRFDRFMNYVETAGPQMKVIVGDDGSVGRYIDEDDTTYHGQIQDEYRIEKSKAHTEVRYASNGQGIVTLKTPGEKSVFASYPDTTQVVGKMIHQEGSVPEVYPCKGYNNGWFKLEVNGKTGWIQEALVKWDAVNSF